MINQENSSFANLHLSDDEIEIEAEVPSSAATNNFTSLSTSTRLVVPKTARDKFFKDLQYETEKGRYSGECLFCTKSKRIFERLVIVMIFRQYSIRLKISICLK